MQRSPSIASPASVYDNADIDNQTVTINNVGGSSQGNRATLSARQRRQRETIYRSVPDEHYEDFTKMLLNNACLQIGIRISDALERIERGARRARPDSQTLPSASGSTSTSTSTSNNDDLAQLQALGDPQLWAALALTFLHISDDGIEVLRETRDEPIQLSHNIMIVVHRAREKYPGFAFPGEETMAYLTGSVMSALHQADKMSRRFQLLRSEETNSSEGGDRSRRLTEPPPYDIYDNSLPPHFSLLREPTSRMSAFTAPPSDLPYIPFTGVPPPPDVQRSRVLGGLLDVLGRGIRLDPSSSVGKFIHTTFRRPGQTSGTASTSSQTTSGYASPVIDLAEEWPEPAPPRAAPSAPVVQRRLLGQRADLKLLKRRKDVADKQATEGTSSDTIAERMSDSCNVYRIEGDNPIPVKAACASIHPPPRNTGVCPTKVAFDLHIGDIVIVHDEPV